MAAELPVVSMVQESEDQQRSLWQQTCQDFEKQGDNMEAILHLAPLEPGTPLAYQGGRCGGLPGREDRRWLRPSSTAGADGGTGPIRNCGTCGRAQEASRDRTLLDCVKNMQMELQVGAPPKRPARLHLIGAMIGLELLVCTGSYCNYTRLIGWVMLLMCWMVLRADDVQWIDPARMHMSGTCLRTILRRTKTTGPGRRAVEVPAYVARDASLSGEDWLGEGCNLYHSEAFQGDRDYLLPGPNKDWSGGAKKFLNLQNLNSYMRYVLSVVKKPLRGGRNAMSWMESGEPFISGEITNFWGGHSGRHWLPTHAANVGIPEEQRDYLGRWQAGAQESNAYVLSAKQIVTSMQRDVNRAICEGHVGLTEGELIEELKRYGEERGVHQRWPVVSRYAAAGQS